MIRLATNEDVNFVMNIINQAKVTMNLSNNNQWDEEYPTKNTILRDINKKELYVCTEHNKILGCITLAESIEQEYLLIPFSTLAIIHRLAVDSNYLKNGIGKKLIKEIENIAFSKNIDYLVMDTSPMNQKMISLIKKENYKKFNMKKKAIQYIKSHKQITEINQSSFQCAITDLFFIKRMRSE